MKPPREMKLLLERTAAVVLDAGGLCSLAAEKQAMRPAAGGSSSRRIRAKWRALHLRAAGAGSACRNGAGMAKQLDAVVVLKGHRTLTPRRPGGCTKPYRKRGPGPRRHGDVLAGMIAGLAAQGLAPAQAAVCGVYLHGLAADRCAARLSQQGMLPEDILADLCALYLENGR
ncbi:MAG: NAD(P)H-hydrate dehydratase [Ruthenibacterium lactatiformans]